MSIPYIPVLEAISNNLQGLHRSVMEKQQLSTFELYLSFLTNVPFRSCKQQCFWCENLQLSWTPFFCRSSFNTVQTMTRPANLQRDEPVRENYFVMCTTHLQEVDFYDDQVLSKLARYSNIVYNTSDL